MLLASVTFVWVLAFWFLWFTIDLTSKFYLRNFAGPIEYPILVELCDRLLTVRLLWREEYEFVCTWFLLELGRFDWSSNGCLDSGWPLISNTLIIYFIGSFSIDYLDKKLAVLNQKKPLGNFWTNPLMLISFFSLPFSFFLLPDYFSTTILSFRNSFSVPQSKGYSYRPSIKFASLFIAFLPHSLKNDESFACSIELKDICCCFRPISELFLSLHCF